MQPDQILTDTRKQLIEIHKWLESAESGIITNHGDNGLVSMVKYDSTNRVQVLSIAPPIRVTPPSTICDKTSLITEIDRVYAGRLSLERLNKLEALLD